MGCHDFLHFFRDEDGNLWTPQAIVCRFRRKRNRKKNRFDDEVTAYIYGGTLATDALEKAVPDTAVTKLLGHQGTAMLHKHDSKPRENRRHLAEMPAKAAEIMAAMPGR